MAEPEGRSKVAGASLGSARGGGFPGNRPIRILVATASDDEVERVRRAVRLAGIEAESPAISKLAEAEEAGRVGEFDVALVGESLLGGSGLDLVRRWAGKEALPVIALVASVESPFASAALSRGAVDAVPLDGAFGRDLPAALEAVRKAKLERRQREGDWEKLLGQTLFDGLTRLPNRKSIENLLERTLPAAVASGRTIAVIAFDIDGMGRLNDRFGRGFGDRILMGVPALLLPVLRRGGTLARSGGDEFVLVEPDTELTVGMEIGETICRRFEAQEVRDLRGQPVRVSVSAGLALGGRGASGLSAAGLLGAALGAAARARGQGGGRLCIASPGFPAPGGATAEVPRRSPAAAEPRGVFPGRAFPEGGER